MARCRHRDVFAHIWYDDIGWSGPLWRDHPEACALICAACHHWLPIGPATDNEQTALEIRAAHLASIWPGNSSQWNGYESLGFASNGEHAPLIERDIVEGRKTQGDLNAYLAGLLARRIVTHEEP